ncbi:MAG TPA: hypothetical protein VH331_04025 [Allosphingosinicella sp.]|jgi:hypothetical protein|nr:hypothetical protein [Allosphingosinicella sp.]
MTMEPTQEQLAEAREITDLTSRFFLAMTEAGGYVEGASKVILDSEIILHAAAQTVALVIEGSPTLKSERDIRKAAKEFGRFVERCIRNARRITETAGRHPIHAFGGLGPVAAR